MAKIQIDGWQCGRCGHTWVPTLKKTTPTICPKCKSPYWNRLRKARGEKGRA